MIIPLTLIILAFSHFAVPGEFPFEESDGLAVVEVVITTEHATTSSPKPESTNSTSTEAVTTESTTVSTEAVTESTTTEEVTSTTTEEQTTSTSTTASTIKEEIREDIREDVPVSEIGDEPVVAIPKTSAELINPPPFPKTETPSTTTPKTEPSTTTHPSEPPTTIPKTEPPTTIHSSPVPSTVEAEATVGEENATIEHVTFALSSAEEVTTPKPKPAPKAPTKKPLSALLSHSSPRPASPSGNQTHNESEVASFNSSSKNGTTRVPSSITTIADAELKSLPSIVRSPRVTVIGYTGKAVHSFNLTEKQILYQIRIFWLEPENWRDRGFRPPNRLFDLFCWLSNDGIWVHDLIRQNFSVAIFTHAQWVAFPEVEEDKKSNFTVDCGMRAINSGGKASDWSFSSPVSIRESPVFLRGFDNINVQGWNHEEIQHLLKTSADATRRDSPQISQGNAAWKNQRSDAVKRNRNC